MSNTRSFAFETGASAVIVCLAVPHSAAPEAPLDSKKRPRINGSALPRPKIVNH